ncbi:hypothetical protein A6E15_08030 [Natrinema saccharevitans]|uniref:Uncharacterized protein n=1 Tax=Natrinema saccharevitans TaxID=301967 RepID=A0A1S8AVU5_9EURY|nr:hypothetical protein A6E15_08030 [Natrinema saccharevitans]
MVDLVRTRFIKHRLAFIILIKIDLKEIPLNAIITYLIIYFTSEVLTVNSKLRLHTKDAMISSVWVYRNRFNAFGSYLIKELI